MTCSAILIWRDAEFSELTQITSNMQSDYHHLAILEKQSWLLLLRSD